MASMSRRRSHNTPSDTHIAVFPSPQLGAPRSNATPLLRSPLLTTGPSHLDKQPWDRWNWWKKLLRGVWLGHVASTALFVSLIGFVWLILPSALERRGTTPAEPCYALGAPGRLLVNLTHPIYTHWRPLDEDACPALPLYLPALWSLSHPPSTPVPSLRLDAYPKAQRLYHADPIPRHLSSGQDIEHDAVSFLLTPRVRRRKTPPTVLIMGDSVDRNGLVYFCQLLQQNITVSLYSDLRDSPPGSSPYLPDATKMHGPRYKTWDQRGLPHWCDVPIDPSKNKGRKATAMRVINGFYYGMDALDEFDTPDHTDWHKPGKAETRIDELFLPMVRQLGGTDAVDLIVLHSGMWDLALFGMQDDKTNWSLTVPLLPEQLAWWQERMRKVIDHLRQRFPKSRIVFRKLHRTDDVIRGTQYITNLRVHQLRHLQEEIARIEGLPIFDYGRVMEGYQLFQEKVHPLMVPGGVMYAQSLMHQLRLALSAKE